MTYILSEPLFIQSPWYKKTYKGLTAELGKKRIRFAKVLKTDDIKKPQKGSFAFIIGANVKWLAESVEFCEKYGIYPIILGVHSDIGIDCSYSSVISDISDSMKYIINNFEKSGMCKTALFGINRISGTNISELRCFEKIMGERFSESDVYYNDGSIVECCNDFLANFRSYDSVISVNDFAAVCLLKKLAESGRSIPIVSYGGTCISERYFPDLPTVSFEYEAFGRAAVWISEAKKNNPTFDRVTVSIKFKIENEKAIKSVEENLERMPKNEVATIEDPFYYDSTVKDLIRIENMLLLCNDEDFEIIAMLARGESYETIAEKLFCSSGTVKYRVKKMKENCLCETKEELLKIIGNYCEI